VSPSSDGVPERDADPARAADPDGFSPDWLALREAADARARSAELARLLAAAARSHRGDPLIVHDLGCGTGSMGRWLVPRLAGPQHWVLHDRDPELLARAAASLPATAADGAPVTIETRPGDVTRLTAADLDGAGCVTASALLDLFTDREVTGLAAACTGAGCPALLTLSVVGQVELSPADPLDAEVAAAFDAHQRRATRGRQLLGPDAVAATAAAFAARGARVHVRSSPWRLGAGDAGLAAAWLQGWVEAAAELRPDLPAGAYLGRRLADAAAGRLTVVVHHADLFAEPRADLS